MFSFNDLKKLFKQIVTGIPNAVNLLLFFIYVIVIAPVLTLFFTTFSWIFPKQLVRLSERYDEISDLGFSGLWNIAVCIVVCDAL